MNIYQIKVNNEILFLATDKSVEEWVNKYYDSEFTYHKITIFEFDIPKYYYKLVYIKNGKELIKFISTDKWIYDLKSIIGNVIKEDDGIYYLADGTKVYSFKMDIIIY